MKLEEFMSGLANGSPESWRAAIYFTKDDLYVARLALVDVCGSKPEPRDVIEVAKMIRARIDKSDEQVVCDVCGPYRKPGH